MVNYADAWNGSVEKWGPIMPIKVDDSYDKTLNNLEIWTNETEEATCLMTVTETMPEGTAILE